MVLLTQNISVNRETLLTYYEKIKKGESLEVKPLSALKSIDDIGDKTVNAQTECSLKTKSDINQKTNLKSTIDNIEKYLNKIMDQTKEIDFIHKEVKKSCEPLNITQLARIAEIIESCKKSNENVEQSPNDYENDLSKNSENLNENEQIASENNFSNEDELIDFSKITERPEISCRNQKSKTKNVQKYSETKINMPNTIPRLKTGSDSISKKSNTVTNLNCIQNKRTSNKARIGLPNKMKLTKRNFTKLSHQNSGEKSKSSKDKSQSIKNKSCFISSTSEQKSVNNNSCNCLFLSKSGKTLSSSLKKPNFESANVPKIEICLTLSKLKTPNNQIKVSKFERLKGNLESDTLYSKKLTSEKISSEYHQFKTSSSLPFENNRLYPPVSTKRKVTCRQQTFFKPILFDK